MKYIFLTSIFFVFSVLSSQPEIKLTIMDCDSNQLLEECLVYSNSGEFLGLTNSMGECSVVLDRNEKIIYIQKFDYKTILDTIHSGENRICLEKFSIILDEVEVKSDLDVKNYLLELIKKTKENSLHKEDTIFYTFDYSLEIPDSNWSDKISGVLVIPFKPITKNYWQKVYYTKYQHEIDSLFKESELYDKCPGNRISPAINFYAEILYKRRKIEKSVKKKRNKFSIDINENTDSTIAFHMLINEDFKYKKNYLFNRTDSSLMKAVDYYLTNDGIKIGESIKKMLYSETTFSSTYPILIKSFLFKEVYDQKGIKVEINFSMEKIDDAKTIFQNKMLPFQRVMMVSNVDGIATLLRESNN